MVSANSLADMKHEFKFNNTAQNTKQSASKTFFETLPQSIIFGIDKLLCSGKTTNFSYAQIVSKLFNKQRS